MSSTAHFVRSVFALGIAQVFSWGGAIALAIVLPRYLGDEHLGKLAFALACTEFIGLAADLGGATYLAKEIARAPTRAGALTANALAMRLPLSLLIAGVAMVAVSHAGYDPLTRQVLLLLCLGAVLGTAAKVVGATLQGLQQMKPLAAMPLVTKLGYAALAAAFLLHGAGLLTVAAASVAGTALGLAIGTGALLRRVRLPRRLDAAACWAILAGGLPYFIWQAALIVYGQIDSVVLSLLTRDAVVGWYAAAYRIVTIPLFMPVIISTVIFPALAAAADLPTYARIAQQAVRVVVLASLPIVLGIMLLASRIIELFGYPSSFASSIAPMILLAPHILLVGVDMMIGTVLNTRDRQRQWALAAVAAAVLNPLLNLAAIPYTQAVYHNGAIGAAAVTTLTEVFMFAIGLRLLPVGIFGRATSVEAAKCAAAGLGMAATVWLTRDLPIVAPVLLGAVAYGCGCLAFGAVSLGELQQVRLHLQARRPAPAST